MHGRTGIETLEAIRKMTQDPVVVLRTAYGTVEEAIEAMKLEANDSSLRLWTSSWWNRLLAKCWSKRSAVRRRATIDEEFFMIRSWFHHVTELP
jgi:DNA-binding NtrC family response regulator